jgi:preprotein translocase subunit YajC
VGTAWAQTGEASGPPPLYNIGFIVLMFAIFYFVLLRPEQRRRREHDKLIAAVKRNDQVVLSCGLHGRVVGLGDKVVTVEIAPKVQAQFDRTAIQTVESLSSGGQAGAQDRDKEREKS